MIRTKREYRFYLMADRMMNRRNFKLGVKERLKNLIFPDYVMMYLKSMRYIDYYTNSVRRNRLLSLILLPVFIHHRRRWRQLGYKLGFSIGWGVLGPGVVIPHNGTIVIGGDNRIGKYAVLQSSICIQGTPPHRIGAGLYMGTGAKIIGRCDLGDYVSVGANAVVTKTFGNNCLVAGLPAEIKKEELPWYDRDGAEYRWQVDQVEKLRTEGFPDLEI